MNLQGSINERQNTLLKLYLSLKQRFTKNNLTIAFWNAMESDVADQIRNLKALPPAFWRQLKQADDAPDLAAAGGQKDYALEKEGVPSLQSTFEIALAAEEPLILETYVPIIRALRKNRAGAALDFYILVKAHLARIVRGAKSFAGDPLLVQRANVLLQGFERELQDRQEPPPPVNRILAGPDAQKRKPAENKPKPAAAARKSPTKSRRNPPKSPDKKVDLPRRRARS
ncbi:MAG: hypothetical protein QM330_11800 [Acidobacteriota bacterium]|jgi:hypothetical protein|nr:hypothetical protein [Acidobacteriota bacterium]NLT31899.1 hypothetical protein [Acidobacteriota bacterium]